MAVAATYAYCVPQLHLLRQKQTSMAATEQPNWTGKALIEASLELVRLMEYALIVANAPNQTFIRTEAFDLDSSSTQRCFRHRIKETWLFTSALRSMPSLSNSFAATMMRSIDAGSCPSRQRG